MNQAGRERELEPNRCVSLIVPCTLLWVALVATWSWAHYTTSLWHSFLDTSQFTVLNPFPQLTESQQEQYRFLLWQTGMNGLFDSINTPWNINNTSFFSISLFKKKIPSTLFCTTSRRRQQDLIQFVGAVCHVPHAIKNGAACKEKKHTTNTSHHVVCRSSF